MQVPTLPERLATERPIVAILAVLALGAVPGVDARAAAHEETSSSLAASEFTVTGTIDEVFPLFDPLHEQEWAPEWKIAAVAPRPFRVERDAVFTTGHDHESVWTIVEYDTERHRVEYVVVTPSEKILRISVLCTPEDAGRVRVAVEYRATPLSSEGEVRVKKYDAAFIQAWREPVQHALDAARKEQP